MSEEIRKAGPQSTSEFQEFRFKSLALNHHGEITRRETHTARQFVEDLGDGVILEMVAIPGGTFLMGSPPGEGYPDEQPQHQVRVAPFLMSKHPITQEQWAAVLTWQPPYRCAGPHLPVDRVSFDNATVFCAELSALTGRRYRLPSEAEWEYACRAGTSTPFSFGPTITTDVANYVGEFTFGAEPQGLYRHVTTEPGTFPPNPLGLTDMHGTLWEWCADAWHDTYDGAPADGSAWDPDGTGPRVLRGGCWHDPPDLCRSAARLQHEPSEGEDYFGFRIALTSLEQNYRRPPVRAGQRPRKSSGWRGFLRRLGGNA